MKFFNFGKEKTETPKSASKTPVESIPIGQTTEQEGSAEQKTETAQKEGGETGAPQISAQPTAAAQQATAQKSAEEERIAKIDHILIDDLEETINKLPENEQKKFREKEKEAALTINKLLQETKIQIKKIIETIRELLLMIPGVNKFFLEQESKLKADQILFLRDEKK